MEARFRVAVGLSAIRKLFRITQFRCANLRLLFADTVLVFNLPTTRLCDFTVRCKGCGENVPAPVGTMPDSWIVTESPLCGSKRQYLPTDIFRGTLSDRLTSKPDRVSVDG